MRKLLFIIVLFFSTSVLAHEKCSLVQEIFSDKWDTDLVIPDILKEEPKANKRIYANCRIANVKANMTVNAVNSIHNACKDKAKDPSIWDWIRYGW